MEHPQKLLYRWLLVGCWLAFALLVVSRGWISEDAFITFRVVDHVTQGYGLRWNTAERVQAFTNPLWLFLHIPLHYLSKNIWLMSLLLSFATSLLAVFLAWHGKPGRPVVVSLVFLCSLALSRSFLDFTSSGLENPLSYLLFACFTWVLTRPQQRKFWFYLSLITALALVNRLDTALLYGPPLAFLTLTRFSQVRWFGVFLGSMPLIAWLLFSFFYYGFFFPNTKYAKLNTGIARADSLTQGWRYVQDLWFTDTVSFLILAVALLAALWCGIRQLRQSHDLFSTGPLLAVGMGILAYCAYVVWAGGDFMSGRFFALPVFAAVWLGTSIGFRPINLRMAWIWLACLALAKLYASFAAPQWRLRELPHWHAAGIVDERQFYAHAMAFIDPQTGKPRWQHGPLGGLAGELKRLSKQTGDIVVVKDTIGAFGFYAGARVTILDPLALSDPLLARLPVINPKKWRVGHFLRAVPEGYIEARETGSTAAMAPHLARYYEKIALVTQGPLWHWPRLRTALALNLGHYDEWLNIYCEGRRFDGWQPHLVLRNHHSREVTVAPVLQPVAAPAVDLAPVAIAPAGFTQIDLHPDLFGNAGVKERAELSVSGTPPGISAHLVSLPRSRWLADPGLVSNIQWVLAPQNDAFGGPDHATAFVHGGQKFLFAWGSSGNQFESAFRFENRTAKDQTLSLRIHQPGQASVSRSLVLQAGARSQKTAAELFPALAPGGFSLEWEAEGPGIHGFYATRNLHMQGAPGYEPGLQWQPATAIPLLEDVSESRLLLPLVPVNDDWFSALVLINLGSQATSAVLEMKTASAEMVPEESLSISHLVPMQPRPVALNGHFLPAIKAVQVVVKTQKVPLMAIAVVVKNGFDPVFLPAQRLLQGKISGNPGENP